MKTGDFIEMEFVGRIVNTNEIFDLTSEEEAKKAGIYSPNHTYGPSLAIIGAGMVIKGVEKQLETMSVGSEKEFSVKPEEAFGPRDPGLIKILPVSKFYAQKINPVPGIFVDIDGMAAKVQTVSGGRVRVDFNHPLAGKELKYKLKIVKQITVPLEKARALLKHYDIKAEPQLLLLPTEAVEQEGAKASTKSYKLVLKTEKETIEPIQKIISDSIMKWVSEINEIKFEKTAQTEKTAKATEQQKA